MGFFLFSYVVVVVVGFFSFFAWFLKIPWFVMCLMVWCCSCLNYRWAVGFSGLWTCVFFLSLFGFVLCFFCCCCWCSCCLNTLFFSPLAKKRFKLTQNLVILFGVSQNTVALKTVSILFAFGVLAFWFFFSSWCRWIGWINCMVFFLLIPDSFASFSTCTCKTHQKPGKIKWIKIVRAMCDSRF